MGFARFHRRVVIASALLVAMLSSGELHAVAFPQFVDPNPAANNQFGRTVAALSTGNVVITAPGDDFAAANAGAVYLFNGATGALISTLRGSSSGDSVGNGGVTVLANVNYVVRSSLWNNGAIADAGAVTWGSGMTGVSGTVSAANSLVGSTAGDRLGTPLGFFASVTALANGNYLVRSHLWDNGGAVDAGAVTWGSGTTGVSGVVSAANSLVGTLANDAVGSSGVTPLSNGNYTVASEAWNNGGAVAVGAVTWGNGTTGVTGTISAANSLVGTAANDLVGNGGATALSNGNYVVITSLWNNGAIADAGAVTWGNGTIGVTGTVSAANSLVGSTANDQVGSDGVTALSNGNYVVTSQLWNNGAIADAGAVTWGNGATGVTGTISAANSLVGSSANDNVGQSGIGGVTALSNGNYVVNSQFWNNGAIVDAGAATWGSGTTGVSGTISVANSLVGSTANDNVGNGGVTALSNGNYVVTSRVWNNGAILAVGAVTWGSGTTGVSGPVSAANSLVGTVANDNVGFNLSLPGVTALSNGNYVVVSYAWNNGGVVDAGAVTWVSGTTGVSGPVSAGNSLVGSTANDNVGNGGVTALSNGNYVVVSRAWNHGAIADAGAATWGNGTTGVTGTISAANSLVGSSATDNVGLSGVTALSNGNYVVSSQNWDHGGIANAGAATWGNGATGLSGPISAANSLVGSTANDNVGSFVTVLSNGDYVIASQNWDNGGIANAGAATWGNGATGVTGTVSAANSLVGTTASAGLQTAIVEDNVNHTFLARFLSELGGRVRVGAADPSPLIVSATDIPNDQGGWLRLTFDGSFLDDVIPGSPPVATYGVWRHVPGTLPARAGRPSASGGLDRRPDRHGTELLRALLPAGLDAREVDGQLYVTTSRSAEIAAVFPPGSWALVASVPALQQAQYLVDVPTISNAAPNDFVVTAHTTVPSSWYISNAISAQSVDNLAPSQPTGLTAAYAGGQTNLQWAANTENDLGAYHLHRGTSADFIPSPGNLIASQIALSYADVGPAGSFYKLSAEDVNGNESTFALITPQQTTDVGEGEAVVFALHGVHPNPAQGNGLHVRFALPSGAPAWLELHDVGGRRVLTREVGALGPGRHGVNLAEGRRVAAGIYWLSLAQGNEKQRARVAVIH